MPIEVPTLDDRDWSALTLGERIRQIELDGYLVIPDLLTPAQVARLKALQSWSTDPIPFEIQGTGLQTRSFVFIDDFIDVGSKLSKVAIGNSIRINPTIVPSRPSFNRASPAKAPNCIGDLSLSASPRR